MNQLMPDKTLVYRDVQKKLGLTNSEYRVLDFISRLVGDPNDPFYNLREISNINMGVWLDISKTSVIRIVNSLVKKGLLKRAIMVHSKNVYPAQKWYKAMNSRQKE